MIRRIYANVIIRIAPAARNGEAQTRALFAQQGYEVAGGTPEDFRRTLEHDVAMWSRAIRAADVRFD
jgi:hypothetical protein